MPCVAERGRSLFAYFVLPRLGLRIGKIESFILTLALYSGAYLAEVFRGALLALPRGLREAGLAIGLTLAMSSTAIVLQTLNEKGLLKTAAGQSSFSVLLFQDLAVIPILAIFPLLAPAGTHGGGAGEAGHASTWIAGLPAWAQTLAVAATVAAVVLAGQFLVRPVFRAIARTRLRELFTAAALLLVIGIALLMTRVGLSPALGQMGGLQLVMPEAFAVTDCGALAETGRKVVEFNLTGESVTLPIMGGKTYNAMTFSGQVPGPTLRVTQGDVIKMTLTIPADEVTGHGNDMHASQMSAGNFESVNPGETSQYCYIAESAGIFKYHCSGVHLIGMDQHVLSGMYGIAIVDPVNGYKKLAVEKTSVSNGKVSIDRQFYDADALEFIWSWGKELGFHGPEPVNMGSALYKHAGYA